MQTPIKSTNISSATALKPVEETTMAAPMKAASDKGVSKTLSLPNSCIKPTVVRNGPPQASTTPWSSLPAPPAISSPIIITESSRNIS